MNNNQLKILPIASLSFWRFLKMNRCYLSAAFPSSVSGIVLRSNSITKAQWRGKIFHSAIELLHSELSSGRASSKIFRDGFNEILDQVRESLKSNHSFEFLGDPSLWPDVARIYKILSGCLRDARLNCLSGEHIKTERTLHSKDKLVFGRVDGYSESPGNIHVIDYKSGIIEDGFIRQDYIDQIHFYAYLVKENCNEYPTRLSLADSDLALYSVKPSLERSEKIASDMKAALVHFNQRIKNEIDLEVLATPTADNCMNCHAKANCSAYWKNVEMIAEPPWAFSFIGTQKKPLIRTRKSVGILEMEVITGPKGVYNVQITQFSESRFTPFEDKVGQRLMVINCYRIVDGETTIAKVNSSTLVHQLE